MKLVLEYDDPEGETANHLEIEPDVGNDTTELNLTTKGFGDDNVNEVRQVYACFRTSELVAAFSFLKDVTS